MYNIIQHSHSGIMWLAVAMLMVSVFFSLVKFIRKEEVVAAGWFSLYSFTKWVFYLQFILGLVLLFVSPKVDYSAGFMKSSDLRFYGMEHPLMMLIAVGLIAIGLFKSKKKTGTVQKNKTIFIYYSIALLVILFMIPWQAVIT